MSTILKNLIYNKFIAKRIIKTLLRLHNFSYKMSGVYSTIINDGSHPKHKIIDYFKWFLDNISEDDVIIDIGCNKGYMAEIMSHKAKHVYGIEILSDFLEYAKSNYKKNNLEFIHHDATTFDYDQLEYYPNVITLSNVLEHIKDRVNFLKKIKLNFKQNIKFLIRVPMIDREWIVI